MPGKLNDCICSFVELVGGAKSQIVILMNSLIALLEALKAYLALFSVDFFDTLRRIEAEQELELIQTSIDGISAPFGLVLGLTRSLSDCPPVASLSKTLKEIRTLVLSDFYEKEYEVEQYIALLQDKSKEIDSIDRLITMLQDVVDAFDQCGST